MSINVTACFGAAPRWETYGVPCPAIADFAYEVDAGLLRTPMESGHARQRRRYTSRPTSYQMTWRVTTAQLHALEDLIESRGYSWIYVPLITGQVPKWMAVDHLIRFTSNLQVQLEQKDLWTASIQAEQYQIGADCVIAQMCNDIGDCLRSAGFPTVTLPPFPPLTPVDPTSFVAQWGDASKYPDPNT